MNQQKLEYLEDQIAKRMKTTQRARSIFRKIYRTLYLTIASLAALNTFLVGMSQFRKEPHSGFAIGALLVSACLAIIGSLEGAIKPKDKFAENANAINKIYDIKQRLKWRTIDEDKPITDDEIEAFFKEFRSLEKGFYGNIAKISLQDPDQPNEE